MKSVSVADVQSLFGVSAYEISNLLSFFFLKCLCLCLCLTVCGHNKREHKTTFIIILMRIWEQQRLKYRSHTVCSLCVCICEQRRMQMGKSCKSKICTRTHTHRQHREEEWEWVPEIWRQWKRSVEGVSERKLEQEEKDVKIPPRSFAHAPLSSCVESCRFAPAPGSSWRAFLTT